MQGHQLLYSAFFFFFVFSSFILKLRGSVLAMYMPLDAMLHLLKATDTMIDGNEEAWIKKKQDVRPPALRLVVLVFFLQMVPASATEEEDREDDDDD